MSFLKTKWSQLWGVNNVDIGHDSENGSRPSKSKFTTATADSDDIGVDGLRAKKLNKRASLPFITSSLRGRNWDDYRRSSSSDSTDSVSDENIPSKHLLHKMASQTLRSFSNSIRSSAQVFYVASTQSENLSLENVNPNIMTSDDWKYPGGHRVSRQRPTILPPSERRASYYSVSNNSDPMIAMKQEVNLPHELEVEIPDSHLLDPCHVFFSTKTLDEDNNVKLYPDRCSPAIKQVWPSPVSIAIARPLEETRQDVGGRVQEDASMGPRHCWEAGRADRQSRYEAVQAMKAVEPEDKVAPKKQNGRESSETVEFKEDLTPSKQKGREVPEAVKPEDILMPDKLKGQGVSEITPLTMQPQALRKVHFEIPDASLPWSLDAATTIVRAETDCLEDTEERVLSIPTLHQMVDVIDQQSQETLDNIWEKPPSSHSTIYDGKGLNEYSEELPSGPKTPIIAPMEGEFLGYECFPVLPPSCDTPYHITEKAENWIVSHDGSLSLTSTSPAGASLFLPLEHLRMLENSESTLGTKEEPQHESSFDSSFDIPFQLKQKQSSKSIGSLPEVHESYISTLPSTGQAETLEDSKSTDGRKSVGRNAPDTPTMPRTRISVALVSILEHQITVSDC